MKFLLWALLILVVLHLLRKKKSAFSAARRATTESAAQPTDRSHAVGEAMVPCAYCGVYIPQSESVPVVQGIAFCSDAHRRLHTPS